MQLLECLRRCATHRHAAHTCIHDEEGLHSGVGTIGNSLCATTGVSCRSHIVHIDCLIVVARLCPHLLHHPVDGFHHLFLVRATILAVVVIHLHLADSHHEVTV